MDINEAFRDRLHDQEVPPPAEVWVQVEAVLRARRRRRLFFWLWAGLALLVVAGGSWQWNQRTDRVATHPQSPTPHSQMPSLPTAASGGHAISDLYGGAPATAALSTRSTSAPTVLREEIFGGEKRPVFTPKGTLTPGTHSAPAGRGAMSLPFVSSALALPLGAVQNVSGSPIAQVPAPVQRSGVLPEAAHTLLQPESSPVASAPTTTTRLAVSDFFVPASLAVLDKKPFQSLASRLSMPPGPRILHQKRAPKHKNRCYNFEQNANVWFLDAYAGPSYDLKLLRSLPDNQPYLAQRLKTEERYFAYNAGIRASFVFNRFYLFRTGLHYDQSTEVFRYFDPAYIQITTIQRPGTNILDTINIQYGTQATKIYNRYSKLDIPLLLGAELRKGNSGFSLNGGALFNVAFWKRGQMLHTDTRRPDWFTPGRDRMDVFRNRVGVSILATGQWFCHLQPRTRIYIEPYYREILRPVTRPNHPLEERHRIFGIQCGVTQILDKKAR